MRNLIAFIIVLYLGMDMHVVAQWVPLEIDSDENLNEIVFSADGNGMIIPSNGPILYTNDDGLSWGKKETLECKSTGIFFDNNGCQVNANIGYVSTLNHENKRSLFKTINNGLDWQDVSPALDLGGVLRVHFYDSLRGFLYSNASFDDRFWYTMDGGVNWLERTIGVTMGSGTEVMPRMYAIDDKVAFIIGGDNSFNYRGAVAKTTNSGESWIRMTLPINHNVLKAIDFADDITGYMVSVNGVVYKTNNQGFSWEQVSIINASHPLKDICFINLLEGFVITEKEIFKTSDGGLSWTIDLTLSNQDKFVDLNHNTKNQVFVIGSNGRVMKKSVTSGIDLESFGSFIITPNPLIVNNEISIHNPFEFISLAIFDMAGKSVQELKNIPYGENVIPLKNMQKGCYLITIYKGNHVFISEKIIISM